MECIEKRNGSWLKEELRFDKKKNTCKIVHLLSSFSPDLAFLAEVALVILKSGFLLENAVSTLFGGSIVRC